MAWLSLEMEPSWGDLNIALTYMERDRWITPVIQGPDYQAAREGAFPWWVYSDLEINVCT